MPKLFLFPSGNAFHGSCLCAEVSAIGTPEQRTRIQRLVKSLSKVIARPGLWPVHCVPICIIDDLIRIPSAFPPQLPQGSTSASAQALRRELEEEVGAEDPFCGEMVVRNITAPFVGEGDDDWAL